MTNPTYDVQIVEAEARPLAAIPAQFSFREVPNRLLGVLDEVWRFIRSNGLHPLGHNVVVYDDLGMTAAGVEVFGEIPDDQRVLRIQTPTGRVVTTAHIGPYAELGAAHEAVFQWCASSGVKMTRSHWEVYGDWESDESKLRTDVFYLLEE